MTNHPQVSIIIATFNAGRDIEGALDSVIGQQLTDWECLIIDGASTDDTLSKAGRYADRDPRIRIYSEPDRGIFDAFNKGWRLARGEWIYYLGSDDRLYPDGLSGLLDVSDDEVDVLYGTVVACLPNGRLHNGRVFPLHWIRFCMIDCHQGFLMRRSVIESMGGFNIEYKLKADVDLMQRSYLAGYKFRRSYAKVALYGCMGVSSRNSDHDLYLICSRNKSNPWPWAYFWAWQLRVALTKFRNKYIWRAMKAK